MKKGRILIIVILSIILVGLIGFGIYAYVNKPKEENQIQQIESIQEVVIPSTLNFNDYYEVVYDESSTLQDNVDAGKLVGAYGDYYHHNTDDFLSLFWVLDKVDDICIDDKHYSFVSYSEAELQMSDGTILKEDGTIVEDNNITEIITCQAEESNPLRFVAILEEK